MLNESKLNEFFNRLQLPEEARALIRRIRSSPPVRRVRACFLNNDDGRMAS